MICSNARAMLWGTDEIINTISTGYAARNSSPKRPSSHDPAAITATAALTAMTSVILKFAQNTRRYPPPPGTPS